MNRQVFAYGKQIPSLLIAVMTVFGGLFVFTGLNGLLFQLHSGQSTVQLADGSTENSLAGLWVAICLGLTVSGIAAGMALVKLKARIEVVGETITSYKFTGKPEVQGKLKGAEFLPESKSGREKRILRTDGGDITVRLTIDGYGILWSLVTGRDRVERPGGYVPDEKRFKAWKQLVTIGPSGITESDASGNVKLHAELDQIVALGTIPSEDYDLYLIHTTKGTIRTAPNLRKSTELGAEIRRVIASRGMD